MSLFSFLKLLFRKSAQSGDANFIDRAPRVTLNALHDIELKAELPEQTVTLAVTNISTSGVAILKTFELRLPQNNQTFRAQLRVGQEIFSIALSVAHNSNDLIGCRFVAVPSRLKHAIESYFAAELNGQSFTEVNSSILKSHPDGKPRWFRGKNGAELFIVYSGDDALKLKKFRLVFLGQALDGSPATGIKYGELLAHSDQNLNEEPSIRFSGSHVPLELIETSQRLIEQITTLEPELKKQLLKIIKGELHDHK